RTRSARTSLVEIRIHRLSCASSFLGAREDELQSFDDEGLERCASSNGLKLGADHERGGGGDGGRHFLAGFRGPWTASCAPGCGHEVILSISIYHLSTQFGTRTPPIEGDPVEDPCAADLMGSGNLAALRLS